MLKTLKVTEQPLNVRYLDHFDKYTSVNQCHDVISNVSMGTHNTHIISDWLQTLKISQLANTGLPTTLTFKSF